MKKKKEATTTKNRKKKQNSETRTGIAARGATVHSTETNDTFHTCKLTYGINYD